MQHEQKKAKRPIRDGRGTVVSWMVAYTKRGTEVWARTGWERTLQRRLKEAEAAEAAEEVSS